MSIIPDVFHFSRGLSAVSSFGDSMTRIYVDLCSYHTYFPHTPLPDNILKDIGHDLIKLFGSECFNCTYDACKNMTVNVDHKANVSSLIQNEYLALSLPSLALNATQTAHFSASMIEPMNHGNFPLCTRHDPECFQKRKNLLISRLTTEILNLSVADLKNIDNLLNDESFNINLRKFLYLNDLKDFNTGYFEYIDEFKHNKDSFIPISHFNLLQKSENESQYKIHIDDELVPDSDCSTLVPQIPNLSNLSVSPLDHLSVNAATLFFIPSSRPTVVKTLLQVTESQLLNYVKNECFLVHFSSSANFEENNNYVNINDPTSDSNIVDCDGLQFETLTFSQLEKITSSLFMAHTFDKIISSTIKNLSSLFPISASNLKKSKAWELVKSRLNESESLSTNLRLSFATIITYLPSVIDADSPNNIAEWISEGLSSQSCSTTARLMHLMSTFSVSKEDVESKFVNTMRKTWQSLDDHLGLKGAASSAFWDCISPHDLGGKKMSNFSIPKCIGNAQIACRDSVKQTLSSRLSIWKNVVERSSFDSSKNRSEKEERIFLLHILESVIGSTVQIVQENNSKNGKYSNNFSIKSCRLVSDLLLMKRASYIRFGSINGKTDFTIPKSEWKNAMQSGMSRKEKDNEGIDETAETDIEHEEVQMSKDLTSLYTALGVSLFISLLFSICSHCIRLRRVSIGLDASDALLFNAQPMRNAHGRFDKGAHSTSTPTSIHAKHPQQEEIASDYVTETFSSITPANRFHSMPSIVNNAAASSYFSNNPALAHTLLLTLAAQGSGRHLRQFPHNQFDEKDNEIHVDEVVNCEKINMVHKPYQLQDFNQNQHFSIQSINKNIKRSLSCGDLHNTATNKQNLNKELKCEHPSNNIDANIFFDQQSQKYPQH